LRSVSYAVYESAFWPLSGRRDVDVIHFPADTGAVIRGRKPIVSTIHGLATLHVDGVRSSRADLIWKTRVSRLAAASDYIITVSESSAHDIASFAPRSAGKIRVIPHGIDHSRFHANRDPKSDADLAGLSLPDRYFLYVGNLDPRKNVLALIEAARRVFESTGVPLVIAGAPAWDSGAILDAAKNTVGVQYVGRVSEEQLLPLMQNAFAFCFPSTYEGFGFPVLEAMASGTPVLCSDRGSLSEVAGDAALVLKDIGPDAIETGMRELAADESLRSDLSARGLANAARYSWEKSVAAHAEVFKGAAR
jgi:glycosyltransferase involved in cell wall biosynthesis